MEPSIRAEHYGTELSVCHSINQNYLKQKMVLI
jgi:DNA repair exonuclease SbcCD ATPase subunit